MKVKEISFIFGVSALILFSQVLIADPFLPHEFYRQSWANNRSCGICHVIKNGGLTTYPPGARVISKNTEFTAEESQAIEMNSSNRLCFVCHQTVKDVNGNIVGHATVGNSNYPSFGSTPTSPSTHGGQFPPKPGGSLGGSVTARINSQGAKGLHCLGCHDVHNHNTRHLLRDDYGQTLTRP